MNALPSVMEIKGIIVNFSQPVIGMIRSGDSNAGGAPCVCGEGRRRAACWQERRGDHPHWRESAWGAEAEFAYTTGHDGHGRMFVNQVVDERGCSLMLKRSEPDGA